MHYSDRFAAGRRLATLLEDLRDAAPVVLGLPRGGVPVAFEVARALAAPLDLIVVRKIGVPFQAEWAMGAVSEGGIAVRSDEIIRVARVSAGAYASAERRAREEADRLAGLLRAGRPPTPLDGTTAVIVDDGFATGATAAAACRVARARGAGRIVLAAPIGAADAVAALRAAADVVVCAYAPKHLSSVGEWYDDFSPVTADDVRTLLTRARSAATERTPDR